MRVRSRPRFEASDRARYASGPCPARLTSSSRCRSTASIAGPDDDLSWLPEPNEGDEPASPSTTASTRSWQTVGALLMGTPQLRGRQDRSAAGTTARRRCSSRRAARSAMPIAPTVERGQRNAARAAREGPRGRRRASRLRGRRRADPVLPRRGPDRRDDDHADPGDPRRGNPAARRRRASATS